MDAYDCIVIGVGTMGAPTCAELARRGRRVLGLDRFAPPHEHGSHHGITRLFRKAYFEHPDYVPLLCRAEELWDALGAGSGQRAFYRTGGFYAGPPSGALIAGSLEAARRHGLSVERLGREEAAARFPQFRVPEDYEVVLDCDAAVILCERAVDLFVRAAARAGAEVRAGEPALEWREEAGRVIVRTERGEYSARDLVIAAGPWAASLLPALGAPLVVTRQVLGWAKPERPGSFAPDRFPVWGIENPDGSLHYGAPLMPGERGIKVALHALGARADPDAVDRAVHDSDVRGIRDGIDRYLNGVARDLVDTRVCLYTNTPDSYFVIDRVPGTRRVYVACGFSGHGFKFAPVVGEALADLVTEGRTRHPIGFLSLDRFRR